MIIVSCILMIMTVPLAYADHDDVYSFDGLTVVFIDLGKKGDSTLIKFPNNKTMLIDGGLASSYPRIQGTLYAFDISTIDVMLVTHPDQDHVSGLSAMLERGIVDVRQILIGPAYKDTATYQKFLALAPNEEVIYAGYEIDLDPDVSVTVLSPPESMIQKGTNASFENSNSVVVLLDYGNLEFLFTADATHTTERWLMQNYDEELDVDVMNSPHHGSKHSSTPRFISSTDPKLVVHSADTDNQYGHPHEETIQRYLSYDVSQVQTNSGNIILQTDGTRCSLMSSANLAVEQPCFDGVHTVPEFGGLLVVMILATALAVVLTVGRTRGLGIVYAMGRN